MRKPFPNSLYEPQFCPEHETHYLKEAYKWYVSLRSDPGWHVDYGWRTQPDRYSPPIGVDVALMYRIWWEGIVQYWWKVTFEEFRNFLGFGSIAGKKQRRHWPRYSRVKCPYRNGNSYRRNTDHEKKEVNPKVVWREVSGKDRDCRKRHWGNATKTFWKRQAARDHRQWVREQLSHENYDAFHDGEYERFADPWNWD